MILRNSSFLLLVATLFFGCTTPNPRYASEGEASELSLFEQLHQEILMSLDSDEARLFNPDSTMSFWVPSHKYLLDAAPVHTGVGAIKVTLEEDKGGQYLRTPQPYGFNQDSMTIVLEGGDKYVMYRCDDGTYLAEYRAHMSGGITFMYEDRKSSTEEGDILWLLSEKSGEDSYGPVVFTGRYSFYAYEAISSYSDHPVNYLAGPDRHYNSLIDKMKSYHGEDFQQSRLCLTDTSVSASIGDVVIHPSGGGFGMVAHVEDQGAHRVVFVVN